MHIKSNEDICVVSYILLCQIYEVDMHLEELREKVVQKCRFVYQPPFLDKVIYFWILDVVGWL